MAPTPVKIQVEETRFECDTCHKEWTLSEVAFDCERRHKQEACSHQLVVYKAHVFDGGGFSSMFNIEKTCTDCEKRVELRGFDTEKFGLQTSDDIQQKLKRLFEVMEVIVR